MSCKFTIDLDDESTEKIKILAERNNLTLSEQATKIVVKYLKSFSFDKPSSPKPINRNELGI